MSRKRCAASTTRPRGGPAHVRGEVDVLAEVSVLTDDAVRANAHAVPEPSARMHDGARVYAGSRREPTRARGGVHLHRSAKSARAARAARRGAGDRARGGRESPPLPRCERALLERRLSVGPERPCAPLTMRQVRAELPDPAHLPAQKSAPATAGQAARDSLASGAYLRLAGHGRRGQPMARGGQLGDGARLGAAVCTAHGLHPPGLHPWLYPGARPRRLGTGPPPRLPGGHRVGLPRVHRPQRGRPRGPPPAIRPYRPCRPP
jgi:hypothetical protein